MTHEQYKTMFDVFNTLLVIGVIGFVIISLIVNRNR